jgi:RNase adapter protein RapZ
MALQKIVSFGYRHGEPEEGPATVVVDIRRMFRNPYRDRTLRYLKGTDPLVQRDIQRTPEFEAKYAHVKAQVAVPGIAVAYIGCAGGHHRSVFLAEKLSQELGVPVEHRDIDQP